MVVLNGKESDWKGIEARGSSRVSIGSVTILVYNNDLPENVLSTMKLFADDSSLFTRVTHSILEKEVKTISDWSKQWKYFFSAKNSKSGHPLLLFNNIPVARETFAKHLGLFLDEKLSFSKHIKEKITITSCSSPYPNLFLKVFLICHINFMFVLIWTMVTSSTITKEFICHINFMYVLIWTMVTSSTITKECI